MSVSSGGGDSIVKGEGPETVRTLRRLPGQVGDESGDGTDVGDDAKDDGDDGEPQSVTRRLARCLEVALRPCFVRLARRKSQDQSVRHLTTIIQLLVFTVYVLYKNHCIFLNSIY